jgi:hypothetical protein
MISQIWPMGHNLLISVLEAWEELDIYLTLHDKRQDVPWTKW